MSKINLPKNIDKIKQLIHILNKSDSIDQAQIRNLQNRIQQRKFVRFRHQKNVKKFETQTYFKLFY